MNKTPIAAVTAALVASMALAPSAGAEPAPVDVAPTPHLTAPALDAEGALVPLAAPVGTVIDVAALPLFAEAQWLPMPAWQWASPFLTGVEICSPFGKPVTVVPGGPLDVPPVEGEVPPADALPPVEGEVPPADAPPVAPAADVIEAPTSDVQHTILVPGDGGNPQGWTSTVSFAPYASLNDSIGALHQYKRYIEACPEVSPDAKTRNDGGIARNDPTAAHGLLVTHNYYMSLFAVATETGVVEVALTRPADAPQADLAYSPSNIVAALRGANVRPVPAP